MRSYPFALLVLAMAAATGPALASGLHHAQPVTAVEGKFALRGAVWTCSNGSCVARSAEGRPATVCAALARKIGPLASFAAGGAAFPAEALESCNARAR